MFRRNHAALSIAALAALMPLAASAQNRQPPPEAEALMREAQQIQAELMPVQEQALQDTALQREQQEVANAVREAMIAADPKNGERLQRLEQIMQEAQVAQQAGDTEKIAALTSEAAELQPQVQAAQAAALEQPEVEARLAAFQGNLRAKMIEIDPNAKRQLDRLDELNRQLQELVGTG